MPQAPPVYCLIVRHKFSTGKAHWYLHNFHAELEADNAVAHESLKKRVYGVIANAKARKSENAKREIAGNRESAADRLRNSRKFRVFALSRFRDNSVVAPQAPKNAFYTILTVKY
jgi:hypothetical protein